MSTKSLSFGTTSWLALECG